MTVVRTKRRRIQPRIFRPKKPVHLLTEIVCWTLCISNVVIAAGIFNNFLPFASTLSLYANILCIVATAPLVVAQGQTKTIAVALALVTLLVIQKLAFSLNFGTGLSLAGGLEFFNILSFIPLMALNVSLQDLLKKLFYVSLVYVLIYIPFNLTVSALDYNDGMEIAGYVGDADDGRGARVVVATTFAAFPFFYGLYHLKRQKLIGAIAVCASLAAVYLSGTRFFLVPMGLAFVVGLLPVRLRIPVTRLAAIAYVLVTLAFCFSLFTGYNPFEIFASDSSGSARIREFEIARFHIENNPLFGIGFSQSGSPEYQALVNGVFLYFSADIGSVGVWADLGLLGLLFYIAASVVMICLVAFTKSTTRAEKALEATAFVIAFYGILAPVTLLGSARIMTAIMIALVLTAAYEKQKDPARRRVVQQPMRRRNLVPSS